MDYCEPIMLLIVSSVSLITLGILRVYDKISNEYFIMFIAISGVFFFSSINCILLYICIAKSTTHEQVQPRQQSVRRSAVLPIDVNPVKMTVPKKAVHIHHAENICIGNNKDDKCIVVIINP